MMISKDGQEEGGREIYRWPGGHLQGFANDTRENVLVFWLS